MKSGSSVGIDKPFIKLSQAHRRQIEILHPRLASTAVCLDEILGRRKVENFTWISFSTYSFIACSSGIPLILSHASLHDDQDQ